MSGAIVGSWGLTEPSAGSDAFGSMHTRARRDGDALRAERPKTFITNAPYADVFVIYAKLEEGNGGGKSIQPFLVERGTPGLDTSKPFKKMGTHSRPTGAVYLDEVRIPAENLLGGGVRERDHVKSRLGDERAGMPTLSLGLADRAFEIAFRYCDGAPAVRQADRGIPARAAAPRAHVRAPLQHAELRVRRLPRRTKGAPGPPQKSAPVNSFAAKQPPR